MTQAIQTNLAIGELLFAATLQETDFGPFLKTYRIPSDTTLMLLESQPRYVIKQEERQELLHFAPFDASFDFTPYTSGRIFHELGELRWERQPLEISIVYTGHKEYKPELPKIDEIALDKIEFTDSRAYLLFGKRLNDVQLQRIGSAARKGDFAEVRIPRLLRYPSLDTTKGAERVQLVMREYIDKSTGLNVAYRCKSLEPFRESKQER